MAPERVAVVPVGADHELFRPLPGVARVPGRIMTTASADVPMKGLAYLLEALAKLRTSLPEAHLVVIGEPRPESAASQAMERLGLDGAVTFRPGVSERRAGRAVLAGRSRRRAFALRGFSLPAVEAMACEAPVVASAGGALPEVVGPDGRAALLVPPADPGALAAALAQGALFLGPGLLPRSRACAWARRAGAGSSSASPGRSVPPVPSTSTAPFWPSTT